MTPLRRFIRLWAVASCIVPTSFAAPNWMQAQAVSPGYAVLSMSPDRCDAKDREYIWTSNAVLIDFSFENDSLSPTAWAERAVRVFANSRAFHDLCPKSPNPEVGDFYVHGFNDQQDAGFPTAAEAREHAFRLVDKWNKEYAREGMTLRWFIKGFFLSPFLPRDKTVAPTAAPASPRTYPDRSGPCLEEEATGSTQTGEAVSIRFSNESRTEVTIWWLDSRGKRVLYRRLGPLDSYVQPTFRKHAWVVADPTGKCIGLIDVGDVLTFIIR